MKLSLTLLFLQLWENVELSSSQNACSKLPDVPHAHVSEETKKAEYQEGDVIHFTCESGYISDHTSKYVCTGAGWLAVRRGMCYSCSVLPDVPHAHVTDETRKAEYQEGDVIHFTCEPGYTSELTIKYVCASEGWLAVSQGLCYYPCQVGKMHPRLFVAGLPPPNERIKTGHKLQFQCSNDLTLNGSEEIECLQTGQWSAPFPTCSVITCEVGVLHPDLIVTGILSASEPVQVGHKLQFDCSGELQLGGSNETECLPTGQWSAPIPTCSDTCKVSGIPGNIVVTPPLSGHPLPTGHKLTFRCRQSRQFIQGNATVVCLANGQWSDSFPTCGAPVGCGKPPPLADGDTKETVVFQYRHNAKVEYICQNVYHMEGGPFKICKNGEWIGQMRCLKPCTMDKDVMRRRNIYFAYSGQEKLYAPHNGFLSFSCIYGTRPVGTVEMRQQCIDGEMNFPTCA
ncbi:complement factor H-related protein 1-like isoform X2 [Acanthochromis polyacanthus]|uniref:complement factor H-related protein 1-like isoform X2 n=1 Tax=Acanthochromis polyacanthus TaxID=80966 RepID=UPI002234A130|nr:complement factor H-related protein 1-like isoform X2 [Acanthochromis polyacanthus]